MLHIQTREKYKTERGSEEFDLVLSARAHAFLLEREDLGISMLLY
jgi:hypothetical protein